MSCILCSRWLFRIGNFVIKKLLRIIATKLFVTLIFVGDIFLKNYFLNCLFIFFKEKS